MIPLKNWPTYVEHYIQPEQNMGTHFYLMLLIEIAYFLITGWSYGLDMLHSQTFRPYQ